MENASSHIVIKRGSNRLFWQSLEQSLEKEGNFCIHRVKWHERTNCRLRKVNPQILILATPIAKLSSSDTSHDQRWQARCQEYLNEFPKLVIIGVDENSSEMLVRFSDIDRQLFLRLLNAFSAADIQANSLNAISENDAEQINNIQLINRQAHYLDDRDFSRSTLAEKSVVEEALAWVDLTLYLYLKSLSVSLPNSASNSDVHDQTEKSHWQIATDNILALLANDYSSFSDGELFSLKRQLEQSLFDEAQSSFAKLNQAFSLSQIEREIVLLVAAPELDGRFSKIAGFLNDDLSRRYFTCSMLAQILLPERSEAWQILNVIQASSALGLNKLVQIESNDAMPISDASLILAPDVCRYILETGRAEPNYSEHIQIYLAEEVDDANLSVSTEPLRNKLTQWLKQKKDLKTIVQLQGDLSTLRWFETAAKEINKNIVLLDYSAIANTASNLDLSQLNDQVEYHCTTAARIARMHDALLIVAHTTSSIEKSWGQAYFFNRLVDNLCNIHSQLVFFASFSWSASGAVSILPIQREKLDVGLRKQIWLDRAKNLDVCLNEEVAEDIARINRFAEVEIDAVLNHFQSQSPSLCDLQTKAKDVIRYAAPKVVQTVATEFNWDDIVLSGSVLGRLKQIPNHVSYSAKVLEQWGYARRMPIGQGVTALFAGRSGTGKTLAAQIIANVLDIELYQVDLAKVVSKYIGETEKNLDQVFEAAEKSNAVLVFNEADALFGKRTEVKDSHDRHANVEVAYLLQRMEMYSGLVILTTNLRQNMDKAFMRRLRFVIDFPDPGTQERELIWRKVFPAQAPLANNINFAVLARKIELPGGNIQQIAIRAAFFAVQEKSDITMQHITEAAREELEKLGFGDTERTLAGLAA